MTLLARFWPHILAGVVILGLFATVLALRGQRDRAQAALVKVQTELADAQANLAFERTDAAAKEQASVERVQDTAVVAAQEKALVEAIKTVPDVAPDAVRVALGCARLRRAGTRAADLPAVC